MVEHSYMHIGVDHKTQLITGGGLHIFAVDERDWEEAIRLTDSSKASVLVDAEDADLLQADEEDFRREMNIGEDDNLDADELNQKAMQEQLDGR